MKHFWFKERKKRKKSKHTLEWKALYRSASPSHWRTSGMSSSSNRTPCWGLVCKQWFSDLRPLPELQKRTLNLCLHELFKIQLKQQIYAKTSLTFPSPLLTSTSTAYTSCTSNSAFSWSFLQKRTSSSPTGENQHSSGHRFLSELTFAGPLGFGW